MSTVSIASPASNYRIWNCIECGAPYGVKEGEHDPETCVACRRGVAGFEAAKLLTAVNELIRGEGVYAILSQAERQEQLNQLGVLAAAKPDACCDPVPTMRLVRTMASEVAGELIYDSEGYQPTPEERDDIESRIEAPELEADAINAEQWDGLS